MELGAARRKMIEEHIAGRGVRDTRVLAAMGAVPRERFVPAELAAQAYDDGALPIGDGQTISQPYVVALMTEALRLPLGTPRVLEVGTGSGYQAAVLAALGAEVWTVERYDGLLARALNALRTTGLADRVHPRLDDGTLGWPEAAPFDGIVVTAGAPGLPRPLLEQLAPGAALVVPVGDESVQTLVRVQRGANGWQEEYLGDCRFVKLHGAHGWEDDN
jgi:protein-L-isoaspartate(D-aspartate) O-methyltransferase